MDARRRLGKSHDVPARKGARRRKDGDSREAGCVSRTSLSTVCYRLTICLRWLQCSHYSPLWRLAKKELFATRYIFSRDELKGQC